MPLRTLLDKNIDPQRIMDHIRQIYLSDRWFDNPHFHRTARYCCDAFRSYCGSGNVRTFRLKADGKTRYGDYIVPRGWEANDAVCTVVRPDGGRRTVGDYRTWPNSLFRFSAPTPRGGVTAEIVYIEGGDCDRDYRGKKVRGNIVFSRTLPYPKMWRLAARHGAIGIINNWKRGHGHQWENHVFVPDNRHGLFGFSLNEPDGAWLEALLRRENGQGRAVTADVTVDTRLYDDYCETVTAVIPGETDEEVLAFAHLYEIGALDNASGCATLLETARVLNGLIAAGKLKRPQRTIRFMFGNECYGLMDYLLNRNRKWGRITAGITPDQFGLPLGRKNTLMVVGAHDANANFADLYLAQLVREYLAPSRAAYRCTDGESSNDGLPSDPCFGIPFPYLSQHVHAVGTWHNSSDTPDKLDAASLKTYALITARYVYGLAGAGRKEAVNLLDAVEGDVKTRLRTLAARCDRDVTEEDYAYIRDLAGRQAASVLRLVPDAGRAAVEKKIETTHAAVNAATEKAQLKYKRTGGSIAAARCAAGADERKAERMVPERIVPGLLTLDTLPEKVQLNNPYGAPVYQTDDIPLCWADGKRDLLTIYRYYRLQGGERSLENIIAVFRFLARHGYIKINRKRMPVKKRR